MTAWNRRLVLAALGLVLSELGDRMRVSGGATTYGREAASASGNWTLLFVLSTVAFVVVAGEVATKLQVTEVDGVGRGRDAVGAAGCCLCVWALSTSLAFERGLSVTVALVALAAMGWALFERTRVGLVVGAVAIAIGTMAEAVFVGQGWFHYVETLRHVANVPMWLPPLYFSAGVAVSQLTRAINGALRVGK
jgi:hypothetical protein